MGMLGQSAHDGRRRRMEDDRSRLVGLALSIDIFVSDSFSASRVLANFGAVWQQFVAFHQVPLSLAMRADPRFFPTAWASHPPQPSIPTWEVRGLSSSRILASIRFDCSWRFPLDSCVSAISSSECTGLTLFRYGRPYHRQASLSYNHSGRSALPYRSTFILQTNHRYKRLLYAS
jgi:hypothetical protein